MLDWLQSHPGISSAIVAIFFSVILPTLLPRKKTKRYGQLLAKWYHNFGHWLHKIVKEFGKAQSKWIRLKLGEGAENRVESTLFDIAEGMLTGKDKVPEGSIPFYISAGYIKGLFSDNKTKRKLTGNKGYITKGG